MERRFILFIVITFVIMASYPFLIEKLGIVPPPPPAQEMPVKDKSVPRGGSEAPLSAEAPVEGVAEVPAEDRKEERVEPSLVEEVIHIETPIYRAKFSSRGAALILWELKSHTQEDRETPILLFSKNRAISPGFSVVTGDPEVDALLLEGNYSIDGEKRVTLREGEEKEITFRIEDRGKGIYLSKRLVFNGDDYRVGIRLETEGADRIRFGLGSDFGITDWGDET
ncbi:MAG TPA: membrane protein insertase YidC, partial [Nitrospiria bacterium]